MFTYSKRLKNYVDGTYKKAVFPPLINMKISYWPPPYLRVSKLEVIILQSLKGSVNSSMRIKRFLPHLPQDHSFLGL